jgi:hypothetical protein
MHNAAGGGASIQADGRNDRYRSIISDLASLIEHVRASVRLIESAIASEAPLGNQEIAGNIVVLDHVTPRYGTGGFAGSDRRPVRLTGRA